MTVLAGACSHYMGPHRCEADLQASMLLVGEKQWLCEGLLQLHQGWMTQTAADVTTWAHLSGDIVGPAVLKLSEDLLARTCSALKVLETESPLFCCWQLQSCQCVDSQTGIAAVPKYVSKPCLTWGMHMCQHASFNISATGTCML